MTLAPFVSRHASAVMRCRAFSSTRRRAMSIFLRFFYAVTRSDAPLISPVPHATDAFMRLMKVQATAASHEKPL